MEKGRLVCIFVLCFSSFSAQIVQNEKANSLLIGFWNLENLYDTLNNAKTDDDEFTPEGAKRWDTYKYQTKIKRIAEVLQKIVGDEIESQLAFFGVCEVENGVVLKDVVQSSELSARHYTYIVGNGPDKRGINPALIYNPEVFKPLCSYDVPISTQLDSTHPTRSILLVKGFLLNQPLVVLVNHWPSRRGGETSSRPNRLFASRYLQQVCDSLKRKDSALPIVVMGDFNDDPSDESIRRLVESGGFQNLMTDPYQKGIGTLAWNDRWHLFDQILISSDFLRKKTAIPVVQKVKIINNSSLRNQSGKFKGYPWRTFNGYQYSAGYSDHFPVCIVLWLTKE